MPHLLILTERQLWRALKEYGEYFNWTRPHQGMQQRIPEGPPTPGPVGDRVIALPILGGLHHEYRWIA